MKDSIPQICGPMLFNLSYSHSARPECNHLEVFKNQAVLLFQKMEKNLVAASSLSWNHLGIEAKIEFCVNKLFWSCPDDDQSPFSWLRKSRNIQWFLFFILFDQLWNLPRFSTLNGKGGFPMGTLFKTTWWLHSSLVNNLTFFLDICTFNLRVPYPFSLLQVLEVTSISSLFPLPVQLDVLSYRLRNMLSCIYLLPNMV